MRWEFCFTIFEDGVCDETFSNVSSRHPNYGNLLEAADSVHCSLYLSWLDGEAADLQSVVDPSHELKPSVISESAEVARPPMPIA